jgi:hypothetical protein
MANDPVNPVQTWAQQTVVFAIMHRNDPSTASLPDEEQAKRAWSESNTVCERLWNEAQAQCAPNFIKIPKVFSKLILKWVQDTTPLKD